MESARDSPAAFYDNLAGDYDRIYADWPESIRRQGDALHALINREVGARPQLILDCAVGIGTQLLGLAAHGHRMYGSDISAAAVRRARDECRRRDLTAHLTVADMRDLPFATGGFDVVVCADNSLPHLLHADEVVRALQQMRRVVRAAGLVIVTTRDYDAARRDRPAITPPQLHEARDGLTVTLQLWVWRADGQRYDLRHIQLTSRNGPWRVVERRTVYWALTRAELTGFALEAGLTNATWREPEETNFFQPLMLARVPAHG